MIMAALFLAISIPLTSLFPLSLVVSAESDYKWRRLNAPSDGTAGGWLLARGSDVKCLTRAKDGTLYAYANPTGTTNRLFKSRDNGATWSYTGDVTAVIVDIAAAPDDAAFIYYATASGVYRSGDAGTTFIPLPASPGGAGAGNVEITAIDVTAGDKGRLVAAATRDKDAGQFGGVYTLDENSPFAWQNTNAGPYDAVCVAFSPDYYYDRRMIAVVNDEVDTFVSVKAGAGGWGASTGSARLSKDNTTPVSSLPVIQGAVVTFPDGFSAEASRGTGTFFIGVNTGAGAGDVYRVDGATAGALTATDLNAGLVAGSGNVDIGALAAVGKTPDINLFAGSAQDNRIYVSRDLGKNWKACNKAPTGGAVTGIVPAADFPTTGKVFAATDGTESAFSVSRDAGLTWNQVGLIDTQIAANDISDVIPSPGYASDRTIFLLAMGTKYHLFRSFDGGAGWERVICSTLPGVDSLKIARLTPAFGKDHRVIYLSGVSGGTPVIWRSADAGESWNKTAVPFNIDVMTLVDDNTLLAGGFTGGSAYVAVSENSGFIFGPKAACGAQTLKSIALSPAYATDRTVIAGNSDGWIYHSQDGGASFKPLPPEAVTHPLSGIVAVAFDPAFAKNRVVYAASNTLNAGVYRFTIGKSQTWERLDTTLPAASSISQIGTSMDGVLYAANNKADGGIERSVNPVVSSGATFETFTAGLPAGAKLTALAVSARQVFAWDGANGYLLTLDDVLTGSVALIVPADKAQGVGMLVNHEAHNIILDWAGVPGATAYEWQLSPTTDFSTIATGYSGTVEGTRAVLPALEPAASYNWRVRVSQPARGAWSDTWTFTTSLGEAVTAPQVKNPAAAAGGIPRRPIFQWDAIAGAESYELIVGADPALATPVISRNGDYAIPGTAWEANVVLDYGTTYYWKVRGISTASKSAWSNVSAFRTEEKPVSVPSPAPLNGTPPAVGKGDTRPAPETVEKQIVELTPAWNYYVMGGELVVIILLIVLLLIIVKRNYY